MTLHCKSFLYLGKVSASKPLRLSVFDKYLAVSAKRDLEQNTGQLRLAEAEKIAARKLRIQLDSVKSELEKKQAEAFQAQKERKEQEEKNLQLLQQAGKLLHKDQDPTLGVLIADMGHKRIYRADPITLLAHTQVWRKQRAFRPVRLPANSYSIPALHCCHDEHSWGLVYISSLLVDCCRARLRAGLQGCMTCLYIPRGYCWMHGC